MINYFAKNLNKLIKKMPFLKAIKASPTKIKMENCKRNGFRNTIFSASSPLKNRYIGEWKNDKKEGRGIELNRYNWVYVGEWFNNKKHGYGILSKILNKNVLMQYAGQWAEGKKQGFGRCWYFDGYFEGCFWKNKRHGFGKMWYNDGTVYSGMWKTDVFHGQGVFIHENGNHYEGQFLYGKKEGSGTFCHFNRGQQQSGCWINDICVLNVIEDLCWRQSFLYPTPVAIPQNELCDVDKIVNNEKKKLNNITYK